MNVEYTAVTVAPITSTVRGVPSEVVLSEEDGLKEPFAVNLHNVLSPFGRANREGGVAQLSSARMREICEALRFAVGCD